MDLNLPLETDLLTLEETAQLSELLAVRSADCLADGERLDVLAECRRDPRRWALVLRASAGGIALKDLVPAQGVLHWQRINK